MGKDFKHVYRFRITLRDIKPDIWRSIEIPENYTFWDFHVAIQDAMGWWDYHLHEFVIKEPRTGKIIEIGIPHEDFIEEFDTEPGWEEKIAHFFSMENRRALYRYDFGDGWEHRVLLQGIYPAEKGKEYPACISGKRACPPEDCGGPFGYQEFLEILKDPANEYYQEMKEWVGGAFDPEKFDPAEVVLDDPKSRFNLMLGLE